MFDWLMALACYIHNYTDAHVTRDAWRMTSPYLTGAKLDLMTKQKENLITITEPLTLACLV